MPSPLVNRYSVYVALPEKGKVRQPIAKRPSLMLAVESCVAAYRSTGHESYVIEDFRPTRVFRLDRPSLFALVYLRAHDRSRYFDVMNQLDRSGDQGTLESLLADSAPL